MGFLLARQRLATSLCLVVVFVAVLGWVGSDLSIGGATPVAAQVSTLASPASTGPSNAPAAPAPRAKPVTVASDDTYPPTTNHYWAGAMYSGTPTVASSLSVNIQIPSDRPGKNDFYYVLLSAWDDNAVYDQIGFSADYGVWGLTWATMNKGCAQMGDYDAKAMVLDPGAEYNFLMTIDHGYVTFTVSTWEPIWTKTLWTGGQAFVVAPTFQQCGQVYYDYTDYEEPWNIRDSWGYSHVAPQWNFVFTENRMNGVAVETWEPFVGPFPVQILTAGSSVTVANEWFALSFPTQDVPLALGTSTVTLTGHADLLLYYLCTAFGDGFCEATPAVFQSPKGWTATIDSAGTIPPYDISLTVGIPAGAAPGPYDIVVGVADGMSEFTTFRITVGLGFLRGGVAPGTLIRTDSGYVPVERVRVGDTVMGYDPVTGYPVYAQVAFKDRAWESILLSVNNGELLVTPFDQPLYVQSGLSTGWIADAEHLHVGDSIFSVALDRWVAIQSLDYLYGRTEVYSLATNYGGTFLANGFLVGS